MKKLLVLFVTALIGFTAMGVYMKAAVLGEVRSLNPYFINSSAERQLIGYLYETLMTTSEGKAVGMLADSWEVNLEELYIVFHLKDRLFHDGRPVTAEDVAYSFNITVQKRLPMGPLLAWFSNAEVLDVKTVKLNFWVLNSFVVSSIPMAIPIIPESVWKDINNPMEFSNLDNPVGTGSLKFKEITPQSVTFSSNSNHPDSPQYLEGIVFNLVQDETMGFLGLVRGDYDYIYWNLDPSLATQMLKDPDRYKDLGLAVTNGDGVVSLLFNHRTLPGSDVNFRKAVQMAIDYAQIVDRVYLGFADVASSGLIPSMAKAVFNSNIGAVSVDIEKAKEYLAKSSYKGEKIRLLIYTSKEQMELAEYIKLFLSKIGINVVVDPQGHEAVTAALKKADFDMSLTTYSLGFHPEMAFYHLHSSRGTMQNGQVSGFNYGGVSILELDETLNIIWTAFDEKVQRDAFHILQEQVREFVPVVPICIPNRLEAFSRKNLEGWIISETEGVLSTETLKNLKSK
jgi:peptide/nickel transport system substrate-binding protein